MRKLALLGLVSTVVTAWQPAMGQDEGSGGDDSVRSGSNSVKVLDLRWGSKQIDIPVLETYERDVTDRGYLGVDDFFNLREANSNIRCGQWELELGAAWMTYESGSDRDDDFTLTPSLKYGITDQVFFEVGLSPINFFDGTGIGGHDQDEDLSVSPGARIKEADNGNGDTSMKLFWQMFAERDIWPAAALWLEGRFPTGDGSEKIDGTLNLNLTKTLYDCVRGHLGGFVKTANGSRGDFDREFEFGDRRDFQWGVGAGLDFLITDTDLFLVNYVNRSSEYKGNATTHLYEAGWVHDFGQSELMLGADYADTRGENEGPRWTGKIQWSITF